MELTPCQARVTASSKLCIRANSADCVRVTVEGPSSPLALVLVSCWDSALSSVEEGLARSAPRLFSIRARSIVARLEAE